MLKEAIQLRITFENDAAQAVEEIYDALTPILYRLGGEIVDTEVYSFEAFGSFDRRVELP